MSAGPMVEASGHGRGHGPASQDFDLNLAPIIDCFVVLIAFMLASAAFLSIGILDAGIAAAGASASPATPPPVNLVVELKPGNQLVLRISGKENRTVPMAPAGGTWNYDALAQNLGAIKSAYPTVAAATVAADDSIQYREVVQTMEAVRKTMPNVLLGGF